MPLMEAQFATGDKLFYSGYTPIPLYCEPTSLTLNGFRFPVFFRNLRTSQLGRVQENTCLVRKEGAIA